ncbi:Crp/Fnr family transcriptional regulator [uncultured Nostoc sp.]|uniref:Crp/Fnr family transcriptional regulator n=1 Tax=uncultured Nostoc sp. TaxID=340711 RepID=UPI0035C9B0B8
MRAAITYQNLATGQVLFHQRDQALAVFAANIGRLRLVRYTREGEIVVFQVVRAGESFAESDLFSEVYSCDAIAEMPSRVIVYPKQLLLTVLRDHPDLTFDLMERLARKSQLLKVRLELRSIRSARERVLQYLLVTAPLGETTVNFDQPLKNVASEIGLSPEVLYRTLTKLENEGTITRARGQITLCTPAT